MRGRVCNLLFLLVPASAVPLGYEFCGTQDHILLSQFLRLPQHGRPSPRIHITQEQGGPDIPLGTGFPFRRLLRLTGIVQTLNVSGDGAAHSESLGFLTLPIARNSNCVF
jgi:hypothetical protein